MSSDVGTQLDVYTETGRGSEYFTAQTGRQFSSRPACDKLKRRRISRNHSNVVCKCLIVVFV